MRAFEIHLNGKRLCVAGIEGDGVMNMMVDHVAGRGRNGLYLRVGGLISASQEHVRWRNSRLKVGDEVALKIIETKSVDRPRARYRTDSKKDERNARAYVQAMARKFGWKLVPSPRRSN